MPEAFSKIRKELFYSSTVLDGKGRIREQVDDDNRNVAAIWSVVEIVFWVFCLAVSYSDPEFERCRSLYIATLQLSIVTFVMAAFIAPKFPGFIRPTIFAMQLILIGAGIGLAFFQWDVRSATFVAVVLIVPVMFLTDTIQTIVCLALGIIPFLIVGPYFILPEVFSWTQKTLLMFAIAGVFIGHVINKTRFERYAFEESALELAELRHALAYRDQLTGLQNRRAYSERVDQLEGNMPGAYCVVSADINGLKQANDTFGHVAGDELIIGAAECLQACFENVGEVYRLGGDEFCVIATEAEEAVTERLLQMEQMAANWKGEYIDGVSISYGVATVQEGQGIESVLKEADRQMYEYKRSYYATSGKDRRSGRDRRRLPDE